MLLAAHSLSSVLAYAFESDSLITLHSYFDFGTERNAPTLYSALALLLASLILVRISSVTKSSGKQSFPWFILSLIFAFLAFDEWLSIHEILIGPFRIWFRASGAFYYSWVIPYGIGVIVFSLAYARFLLKLQKRIAILLVVSGAIYVTGALVTEMIMGVYLELNHRHELGVFLLFTIEELLEMLGIALFTYTLITFLVEHNRESKLAHLSGRIV